MQLSKRAKKRLRRIIFSLILLGMLGIAVRVLFQEISAYRLEDFVQSFRAISPQRIGASMGFMVISYAILTLYDVLGFIYIRQPFKYYKVAFVSFISYVLSINVGIAVLSGSTVRYRFYSGWGLPSRDIAKMITFCVFTFWLGFIAISGVFLVIHPIQLSVLTWMPISGRLLGLIMMSIVTLYFVVNLIGKTALYIKEKEFILPSIRLSLLQLIIGMLDFLIVATVMYFLFPAESGLPYMMFVSAFLFSQIAGLISNIPGGIGVFDSLMVLLLKPYLPVPTILGTLVMFRLIYYILPLLIAVCIGIVYEVPRMVQGFHRMSLVLQRKRRIDQLKG